jgi:hypothetical protein
LKEAMRRWVAVLGFSLIACSQTPSSPIAGATASPMQSATPTPQPSPTPVADLPLTKVDFSCRLPISISVSGAGIPSKNGFVSFPSGVVTIDPAGKGGAYFDRAFSRWLPVARNAVSPDGSHYAYVDLGDGVFNVHVVDVRTGTDHVLREKATGFSFQPFVLDYASEGIYIGQGFERVQPGLWLVAPTTGAIRKVSKVGLQVSAGRGVFWSGEINPADPNPIRVPSSAGTLTDQIDRIDIKSGTQAVWLYQPGKGLNILGLDIQGHPLMSVYSGRTPIPPNTDPIDHSATELLIALDSKTQRSIYKGQLVESLGGAISDAHGVWFGSPQGIYLYSNASGLQKVFDQPGSPANGCF